MSDIKQEVESKEKFIDEKLSLEIEILTGDEIKKSLQKVICSFESEPESTDVLFVTAKKVLEQMNSGMKLQECCDKALFNEGYYDGFFLALLRDQVTLLTDKLLDSKKQNYELNEVITDLQLRLKYSNNQVALLNNRLDIHNTSQHKSKVALEFVTKFIGSQFESFTKSSS